MFFHGTIPPEKSWKSWFGLEGAQIPSTVSLIQAAPSSLLEIWCLLQDFQGFIFTAALKSPLRVWDQKGPEFSVYFPLVQDIKLSLSQWTRQICGWSMFSRKIIHFELQIMANPPCPWELVPACKMCTWCPIQFNVVFTSRHQLSYFSSSSCYQVLPCSVFCAVIDSALICLSKKIQMLITKAFPSSGTFPLLLTL